ncbi:Receptor-type tyrosine-protein phosphatase V [Channa argus]|uniref:Receptor-type tyrosine-protein phosphatase V n=1 Tax=Channa argus TaxID=215402 RepID=A0A6G1PCV8_CHAAH|nr:Receptor-type tyrosine-protein phosphatase V [Channa argus]
MKENLKYEEKTHNEPSRREQEFFDASDSFNKLCFDQGEGTSPTPQGDYVPSPSDAGSETVSLCLAPTDYTLRCKLHLHYYSNKERGSFITEDCNTVKVGKLQPGTEYRTVSVFTEPVPPEQVTVSHVSTESVSLQWEAPPGEVESYTVTCCNEGEIVQELTTNTNSLTFSDLKPGMCYSLHVSVQLKNGRRSEPAVTTVCTKTHLESLLEDLGLKQNYTEKLSLSSILQIDKKIITDEPAKCNSDLPWYFLKTLMMVNVTARNVKCSSV